MNDKIRPNGQSSASLTAADRIKVSVIIPVYQVENYLERAIDSVLASTLKELEIILVDDGSPDDSGRICDSYKKAYPAQIKVLHKENEGLGMARNSGVQLAKGEYIAFLDSDDTIEPQMYEKMYEKASEGDFQIVMCDVRILYVEDNHTVVVSSYKEEEVDTADYIANGNNITYSVNKLFKRFIWEENQYEKMLFEDISLIPSLITRYPHIGYVKEAFYNYYRRANTISTSLTGGMTDIIKAYKSFLKNSAPEYKEEAVYCIAKQLFWNMTDARPLFLPDFITFLKEYKKYFLLNPLLSKDAKVNKILDYLDREVIPDKLICVKFSGSLSEEFADGLTRDFPMTRLILADKETFPLDTLPESVVRALKDEKDSYAEEYYALRLLCREGGIVLFPDMKANLRLKKLRMNEIFFGFENDEELTCRCFGALKEHYVIQALLDTYEEDNIYNKALLPLSERVRDFLIIHFSLRPNGRNQLLKKEIQVYLPSILAYDMQDGENCCRHMAEGIPNGYELISERVVKMWSDRLMENWNLYKQERDSAGKGKKKENTDTVSLQAEVNRKVEQRLREEREKIIQEVSENYENSTCWKITRPIRAVGKFFGK